MERIAPFDAQHLEAACRVLADTTRGLTGPQIGHILQDMGIVDVSPEMAKWKRLFNALAEAQNKHQVGNHLIMFTNRAMNPVSYARDKESFEWRRDEVNVVLAFSGFVVREDGKVARSSKESTLAGARARAGRMKAALENRNVHSEGTKGVAERIRVLSGLTSDGAELVNEAFGIKNPILALNPLLTESEKSEQKGFTSLLIGLFGTFRNPLAHAPRIIWPMTEQDSLDILTLISLVHRRLDGAVKK
jgi:uncharacterized protein (TIGR02391 family)